GADVARVSREGRVGASSYVEALADKAGAAARTRWSEVSNGAESGWRDRSAEGRDEGLSQKGAASADPSADVYKSMRGHGPMSYDGSPKPATTEYLSGGLPAS